MGEVAAERLLLADAVALHLGLAGMLGAVASCAWVRDARSAWAEGTRAAAWRALWAAIVGSALADAVGLWLQAELMTDAPLRQSWPATLSMVTTTHLGHAAVVGMAALAATGALAWFGGFRQGRAFALVGTAVGAAVFAYSRSIVSHAGDAGDASVAVAAECIHLLSTCLWVGMVLTAAFARLGSSAPPGSERDSLAWIASLSTTAAWALGAVVATGIYNTWRGTGAMIPSAGTPYGNALLIKLGFVVVAIGIAAINRFNVMPQLVSPTSSADDARRSFVTALRIEACVLLAALIAAAFLGRSEPPPRPSGGALENQRGDFELFTTPSKKS